MRLCGFLTSVFGFVFSNIKKKQKIIFLVEIAGEATSIDVPSLFLFVFVHCSWVSMMNFVYDSFSFS